MLQDQTILRIPGPSPIPPSVQRAMNQSMIGHRGKETSDMLKKIAPGLKKVFGTTQEVAIIAGSGTAGLETAVVNVVKPGEEVLVVVTGAFGDRFTKICEAFNIKVHVLNVEWGKALNPEEIKAFLAGHPEIKVVFSTYCETSTGVLNPIDKLALAVQEVSDALIVVDGVSCVAGVETKMDEWGIDVMVTGSQKAFMLPAGLTFVAASEKAWKVIEENDQPRFYLSLKKYRDNLLKDTTPFTPALSLLFGLEQVLSLLEAEGLNNVYSRHALMKDMTRAAFKALGIPLLTSDEDASPTVTAVQPEDFDAEEFRKILKKEFAISIAGGQQHLTGKIFRIGHMGYCSPADQLQIISAIEVALKKLGKNIELGKGTAAAQQVYLAQ
ncbi:alanine--glyoxylate aminotransferase family protein [Psychrobacillus sp. FSL K6-2684]|uniref:Alanine--glyoxylate aminotransferase family protein n=1 Tax=Psychrobacillus faecigallinarum TaxID=2762235 RepID=A0ABR8RDI1_9BACI|nr:alanine--glyoxylate aminotransferase family protein [Psychrobacillus faecigallinarum]MBD7945842.1 alanine--glyoxylate aminotransferase family protein [Psychrobacillus faecigallinarum]QGM29074.1 aminotransferase class V-fold PLP-dependent enzyme [Bacillus sp. N3536]